MPRRMVAMKREMKIRRKKKRKKRREIGMCHGGKKMNLEIIIPHLGEKMKNTGTEIEIVTTVFEGRTNRPEMGEITVEYYA